MVHDACVPRRSQSARLQTYFHLFLFFIFCVVFYFCWVHLRIGGLVLYFGAVVCVLAKPEANLKPLKDVLLDVFHKHNKQVLDGSLVTLWCFCVFSNARIIFSFFFFGLSRSLLFQITGGSSPGQLATGDQELQVRPKPRFQGVHASRG